MADITVTPANVAKGTNGTQGQGIAGVTIAQGKTIYLDTATNTMKLADALTAAKAACAGVALNSASAGQPVAWQDSGPITIGATVVQGKAYYVSATAGGICPEADLLTGQFATFIGHAISASQIQLGVVQSGVAKA